MFIKNTFKSKYYYILSFLVFVGCESQKLPQAHYCKAPKAILVKKQPKKARPAAAPHAGAFFEFLTPHALRANERVLKQRSLLLAYETKGFGQLNTEEKDHLAQLAKHYRVPFRVVNEGVLAELLKRVDIIPVGLVLAQAANESAYGQSRFAKEAHNYFGQWCFEKGCGLVPKKRAKNAKHEVKRFKSPYHAVKAYMLNLNSHPAYEVLRTLRMEQRKKDEKIDAHQLAFGLYSYSEKGHAYVGFIQRLIKKYNLNS